MKEEQLAKIPAGKPVAKPAAVVKLPTPATTSVPKSTTTLAVDVGGTGIKAAVLDEKGKMITERQKIKTPHNATPKKVIAIIQELAKMAGEFDRASIGFPGVIKNGVVYTAANLGKGWKAFNLEKALKKELKVPVRIANDADVQGLGCVTGHGVELVITLGTGFGSVLFVDGHRIHLELGHHPFHNGKTYEDELGIKAFRKKGKKKWNRILGEAIDELSKTFNYDRLYIGGGNAEAIDFKLPENVKIVSNTDGLLGGIKLWQDQPVAQKAS
ncbi:ROK family protein [Candidatus Binatus sp.]|uniref:ROK family protein n=1 Tax=Candidatus Binatus sp. TaxID=2811406 RepID=UPI003CBF72B8